MRIAVVGASHVGLVSGTCLAELGHTVVIIDSASGRIDTLKAGRAPIHEPGLDTLVARNIAAGRLSFTGDLVNGVLDAQVVFLAVRTPSRCGNGHADLSHVYAAVDGMARAIGEGCVVVTRSTVPVGTGDAVERRIRTSMPGLSVSVASNPQFLREGSAVAGFMRPERIVLGIEDEHAARTMGEVYGPLLKGRTQMMVTSRRNAELIKYTANAFLATKISFINEVADLCERLGTDVTEVARGIGLDGRIGPAFLEAGPGFGGHGFPRDARTLAATAREIGAPLSIVEKVVEVNEVRQERNVERVLGACGGCIDGKTIAVLGLSFKAGTDAVGESPAITLIEGLQERGARVRACDPCAAGRALEVLQDVVVVRDAYACASDAHAVVVATEWDAFRALDLRRLGEVMARPVMVDLRNLFTRAGAQAAGLQYVDVGRNSAVGEETGPAAAFEAMPGIRVCVRSAPFTSA